MEAVWPLDLKVACIVNTSSKWCNKVRHISNPFYWRVFPLGNSSQSMGKWYLLNINLLSGNVHISLPDLIVFWSEEDADSFANHVTKGELECLHSMLQQMCVVWEMCYQELVNIILAESHTERARNPHKREDSICDMIYTVESHSTCSQGSRKIRRLFSN